LRRALDRDLDAVVVNGVAPRRFTKQELTLIEAADAPLTRSAARTARAAYERSRIQQNQIARLRRQRFADGIPPAIATIPFVFAPTLDLAAVREIATRLERSLR
jgi:hypothetical protein